MWLSLDVSKVESKGKPIPIVKSKSRYDPNNEE